MTEQNPVFKIGDRGTWVHTSSGKHVVSWSVRTGTIEGIHEGVAVIRYGKKTLCKVPLSELNEAAETKMGKIVESLR